MEKPVKNSKSSTLQATELRRQAKKFTREKTAQSPENIDKMTPAQIKRTLQELRVHQIELELQNEELRRAQAELDMAGAHFFDFYDLAPVGYFTLSEKGLIIEANLVAATLLGMARSELVKQPLSCFILPEDQDIYYLKRKQLFETYEPQMCELRMAKKDGSTFWVRLNTIAAKDTDGKPTCRIVMSNITDHKRAEEQNRFQSSITENISDAIIVSDVNFAITYVNKAGEQLYGYTMDELKGKMPDIFNVEPMAAMIQQELYRTVSSGKTYIGESLNRKKDGSIFHCDYKVMPLKDPDGKIVAYIGLQRDITERKRAEEALRESRERYNIIFDQSPIAIEFYDSAGRLIHVNRACINLFGLVNIDEISGFKLFEDPNISKNIKTKLLNKETVRFEAEFNFEEVKRLNLYQTTCSGIRILDWSITPLINGDLVIGYILQIQDITKRKRAEDELHETNAYLENLINYANAPIIVWDTQFRITRFNHAFEFLTGRSESEVIGQTLEMLFPSALVEESMALIRKTLTGERWETVEIKIMHRDESVRTVLWNSATLFAPDGQTPIATIAQGQDITKRKQAEDELRVTLSKFKTLFEYFPLGITVADEAGNILESNPIAEKLLAVPLDEHNQRDIDSPEWRIVRSDGTPMPPNEFASVIALKEKRVVENMEMGLRKPDNVITWLSVTAAPLPLEGQGVVITYGDITQRKRSEEALRESEEKMSTLFGSMTEMVVLHELVFNSQGDAINYRITDCNNAFTKITGIKKEDAVGKLATKVYGTEAPPYLEEFLQVALIGKPYEYTTYFAPRDKHFAISVISPRKNQFATITTDVTAIKQIHEVISAKNKELENYLYIASHDLRSPLVNIQGFSQRLQKQADSIKKTLSDSHLPPATKASIDAITDKDIPKTLNFIFSSVKKMDTLLNGLLHLSRTGGTIMAIKQVDMNQVFKIIIDTCNFQLTESDAVVTINDLPSCYGDENLLSQLFSNIIGNAIKYRDKNRQLVLEITAHREFGKAIYSIRDNGLGIESRHLERIWDVFYQVDSTSAGAGEGLGLSSVKKIAEKHNGRVWAESEFGKGCVFHVELQTTEFSE